MQEKVIRTHIEENQKKQNAECATCNDTTTTENLYERKKKKRKPKQKQRAAHEHWGDAAPIDEASAGSSALLSANQ